MIVYVVYRDIYVDGLDLNSLKIFRHKREAISYQSYLEKDVNFNKGYFTVEILEEELL
jgi:hypothetical protein